MMPTTIIPIADPVSKGASTKLDLAILDAMDDGMYYEPRQIRDKISLDLGVSVRDIYPRLRVLVDRKVIERYVPPNGPKRGLGAGLYRKT